MLHKFFPAQVVESVYDVDLEYLKKSNIKGLLLDIDNTLAPMHIMDADNDIVDWIKKLKENGFKACIISNATRERVTRFNKRLGLLTIHKAYKPSRKAFYKAMKLLELQKDEIAVIGDQIFTDIYGGNRAGIMTILVRPLDKREDFLIRLKRFPERIVLSRYNRKYPKKH